MNETECDATAFRTHQEVRRPEAHREEEKTEKPEDEREKKKRQPTNATSTTQQDCAPATTRPRTRDRG